MTVYEKISEYIKTQDSDDLEQYFDGIEKCALELYPNHNVYIYDYDTGNDTYELDRQLDDILDLAKRHQIVDFCNCWDNDKIITTIITK